MLPETPGAERCTGTNPKVGNGSRASQNPTNRRTILSAADPGQAAVSDIDAGQRPNPGYWLSPENTARTRGNWSHNPTASLRWTVSVTRSQRRRASAELKLRVQPFDARGPFPVCKWMTRSSRAFELCCSSSVAVVEPRSGRPFSGVFLVCDQGVVIYERWNDALGMPSGDVGLIDIDDIDAVRVSY